MGRASSITRLNLAPLVAIGLLCSVAAAGAVSAQSIRASVERSSVPLDSQLQLTVVIEGTQTARPTLPELPDFRVVSRGSGARELSIINGVTSQKVSFRYLLIPSRVGRFEIGPVTTEVDGQVLRSDPFSVEILAAGQQPAEQQEAFLTVSVSDRSPFVGEQVLYTWRFYRRVRVADARITRLDFGDLVAEELGEVTEYDTNYRGVPYRVSELKRALFAQRPGKYTIDPAELTCEIVRGRRRSSIFDFGRVQTRTEILRSRPIEIEARALPGAPAGFSGLVGEFGARATLSKNELKVGESATLELRIQGSGNVQLVREPAVSGLDMFKVYEDQPVTRIDRSSSSLRGSKTFRKALVPLQAGVVEIPPVEVVFFDPNREAFRTSTTERIPVQVQPGDETEDLMLTESLAPTAGKVAVRVLADDILPIRRDFRSLVAPERQRRQQNLLRAGLVLPPSLTLIAWLVSLRRRRYADDTGRAARKSAFRNAVSALEDIRTQGDDVSAAAVSASSTLRTYVGRKLGRSGEAMTPLEIEQAVVATGVTEETGRETRETLERLEALVYGGDQRRFTGEQLAQSAERILRELEAQLGRRVRLDGRGGARLLSRNG